MVAHNEKIRVELYGQELNGESFGICKSDMLVTGHNPEQIAYGNTLTEDAHKDKSIVMNGSPLFTGGANSGESEIRRWMLENDWVEAIIALPTDLFYNTGIQTYVWMLTNRKQDQRLGKVQLIDASGERFWKSIRKNLGSKRREITDDARNEIVKMYSQMLNGNSGWGEYSKIFDVADFAYREVRVERPLKLNFQFDAERLELLKTEKAFIRLSDEEQTALLEALSTDVPTFNRYFYQYVPPRPVAEIDEELKTLEAEIANLLKGVAA